MDLFDSQSISANSLCLFVDSYIVTLYDIIIILNAVEVQLYSIVCQLSRHFRHLNEF